jgi:hypothetical protein
LSKNSTVRLFILFLLHPIQFMRKGNLDGLKRSHYLYLFFLKLSNPNLTTPRRPETSNLFTKAHHWTEKLKVFLPTIPFHFISIFTIRFKTAIFLRTLNISHSHSRFCKCNVNFSKNFLLFDIHAFLDFFLRAGS